MEQMSGTILSIKQYQKDLNSDVQVFLSLSL